MRDFTNIEYLKNGNLKQLDVYEILTKKNILVNLAEFNPIFIGTIPINIDIQSSDIDLICYWQEKKHFIDTLNELFKNELNFKISECIIDKNETIIAHFYSNNYEIEIFGQNIPVKQQNGYQHMIIEDQILQEKGEKFRQDIIALKQKGYKTEPAFGLLLGLNKNPYLELLEYKLKI